MTATYDAIVIGGGHNGLVAAVYLARAGWRVLVLEAAPVLGGAVQSAEITRPGFVHDLYSTNQNGFLGGPVWGELQADLQRHGLAYAACDKPYANAFPDGSALKVFQDPERTLAGLRAHDPGDAEGWAELFGLFERYTPTLFGAYGQVLPSDAAFAAVAGGLESLRPAGMADLSQLLLSSTRELGDAYMSSREAKALMASWAMHIDFGPDVSGGSLFPFVECFADMLAGMSIVQGGASRMIDALVSLLRERGGETRTDARVARIHVAGGRATEVELEDGERIGARRAIVASTTPKQLFVELIDGAAPVPEGVRKGAARWRHGAGTMMVHLALDGPVPWRDAELGGFAYVHVAPYVEDLAETYTDAENGLLPASPLLVVGQSSVVDPSRAPEGKHVLWVQVRAVPGEIRGDRLGEIDATNWGDAADPYADRVLAKLEEYAPGLSALVLDRAVLSPADLERHDANLVGGDNGAGSHHLRQNFLFRPLPTLTRYRTPVEGLWMTGAATWPGAGVHGISGYLAAREILTPPPQPVDRIKRGAELARIAGRTLWRLSRRPR